MPPLRCAAPLLDEYSICDHCERFLTNVSTIFSPESMQALPDHVLMMQIDCEVINTGLVHIKEDAIPIHLSARMRTGDTREFWSKADILFYKFSIPDPVNYLKRSQGFRYFNFNCRFLVQWSFSKQMEFLNSSLAQITGFFKLFKKIGSGQEILSLTKFSNASFGSSSISHSLLYSA